MQEHMKIKNMNFETLHLLLLSETWKASQTSTGKKKNRFTLFAANISEQKIMLTKDESVKEN